MLGEQAPIDGWRCVLGGSVQQKDEVDLTVLAGGEIKRTCSSSYTLELKPPAQFPASLGAPPRGCSSSMNRLQSGAIKVEE